MEHRAGCRPKGVLVVALGLFLSGCSLFGPAPDAVAKQWMQAYAANDGATMINLTCAADQAQLQQGRAVQAAVSGLASGLFGGPATQVTVANLSYETTDKSGSQATVHVSGPMGVTLLGLSQTQNVDLTLPLKQENGKWRVCPG